ncbi:hypothetical protein PIB30_001602 [Stylosanthes scabra]|uniref:DUF4283 domain-containing protein n=1 Tax=Stylosanthes scabra TaxID=79078 RepID=A0ABU6S336_9FABA|nr:hypothetical protein [Stylosanthes scabra]
MEQGEDPNSEEIPIKDDEVDNLVVLEEEDEHKGRKACSNSLIGRIFANQAFSVEIMENALCSIWDCPAGFRVVDLKNNQFQFYFDVELDMLKIEKESPWLFKHCVLHNIKDSLRLVGPDQKGVEGMRSKRRFLDLVFSIRASPKSCHFLMKESTMKWISEDKLEDWIQANQTLKRIDRVEKPVVRAFRIKV